MKVLGNEDIKIIFTEDRKIVIGGIGKAYYQDGFPISMAIDILNKQGLECSWFHIIDELYRNGFKKETILSRVKEDIADSGGTASVDINLIKEYLDSEYEVQREMIFKYLWGTRENATTHLRAYLKHVTHDL